MRKITNTRSAFVIVGGLVLLAALGVFWDLWIRHGRCINCDDGQRCTIDARQFDTEYSAYSLQLEASLQDKAKVSIRLDPHQLEQLSEAMQSANEFRKYVVAGFNSCAMTRAQYSQFGARFQLLDNLARQINDLTSQGDRSAGASARVTTLVDEYAALSRKLGSD